MEAKHLSYQAFLGMNPNDLMRAGRPRVFCVHNAKLSPSAACKLSDTSPMAGLVMERGSVYVFCSDAGITLYERDVYQDINMLDLSKSHQEDNMQLFSKIVSFLVPRHL